MRALFAFLLLASCARKGTGDLTPEKFAFLSAREQLIGAYFEKEPDSAKIHIDALYAESKVTAGQVRAFYKENQKSPEKWADIEALILKELEGLDPRKAPVGQKKIPPVPTDRRARPKI